jgi:hypothetical protein
VKWGCDGVAFRLTIVQGGEEVWERCGGTRRARSARRWRASTALSPISTITVTVTLKPSTIASSTTTAGTVAMA